MIHKFYRLYVSSIPSCILFEVGKSDAQNITYIDGEQNLKIQR